MRGHENFFAWLVYRYDICCEKTCFQARFNKYGIFVLILHPGFQIEDEQFVWQIRYL